MDPSSNAVPDDLEVGSVYGGDHLKAADVPDGKKFTVKVDAVTLEMMPARDGKPGRKKLVLSFVGATKTLVLNATNANVLSEALGNKPATWRGATLILERSSVPFGGQIVPALRVTNVTRPETRQDPFQAGADDVSFLR
jgi:hypothetical protein